jgi:hypothetical protein
MKDMLYNIFHSSLKKPSYQIPSGLMNMTGLDLSIISAVSMHFNCRQQELKLRSISLYKINCILNERELELQEEELQDNQIQMPEQYAQFADIILKRVSDTLLSNYLYNYKIKLTVSNNLCPSLLYKMSIKELKIIKQYLINNLNKDFIESSTAP